jgi:hypothetical protein
VWWFLPFSCFCCLRIWLCATESRFSLILCLFCSYGLILPVLSWFVCFHILCAEFFVESSVVVAWWSYIVMVCLSWKIFRWWFCWVEYPRVEVIFIQCPRYLTPCPFAFNVSIEKSAVTLMGLSLYIICFSLFQPSIFFLCCLCLLF